MEASMEQPQVGDQDAAVSGVVWCFGSLRLQQPVRRLPAHGSNTCFTASRTTGRMGTIHIRKLFSTAMEISTARPPKGAQTALAQTDSALFTKSHHLEWRASSTASQGKTTEKFRRHRSFWTRPEICTGRHSLE